MKKSPILNSPLLQLPPYWYLLSLFLLVSGAFFIVNLQTGTTPGRVAIHFEALNFDIYWYGILITGGIALGSYMVAYLVEERAKEDFESQVPPKIRQMALTKLTLSDEIMAVLSRNRIKTVGDLLFNWGLEPALTGLNPAGQQLVRPQLEKIPAFNPTWLDNSSWAAFNPNHVWNGVAWCLIFAIIGARLYHVLTPSPSMAESGILSPLDYFRHPEQLLNIRRGGLGLYGGIAGGALGLWFYTRRNKISFVTWADFGVVGVALGQVIGRWGNYVNQELYGRPSDLPWAITIDPAYRLTGYTNFSRFHPTFLYESLWNLGTFLILHYLTRQRKTKLLPGDLTALYLILYAIGRIVMESVRLDSRMVSLGATQLPISIATAVSIVIALIMGFVLVRRHWA